MELFLRQFLSNLNSTLSIIFAPFCIASQQLFSLFPLRSIHLHFRSSPYWTGLFLNISICCFNHFSIITFIFSDRAHYWPWNFPKSIFGQNFPKMGLKPCIYRQLLFAFQSKFKWIFGNPIWNTQNIFSRSQERLPRKETPIFGQNCPRIGLKPGCSRHNRCDFLLNFVSILGILQIVWKNSSWSYAMLPRKIKTQFLDRIVHKCAWNPALLGSISRVSLHFSCIFRKLQLLFTTQLVLIPRDVAVELKHRYVFFKELTKNAPVTVFIEICRSFFVFPLPKSAEK